ncbi:MAG: histidinol-phosphate transaminase [Opitutales bacterium]|nr:histidinol-phosphate transaminase [Opitutales bacterium]
MQSKPYKISKNVETLSAYTPGEQPQGGGWVKLNTNEFPYPPSPKIRAAVLAEMGEDCAKLRLYPEPLSKSVRSAVARHYGVGEKNVIVGNGSDDILNLIMRAFGDENLKVAAMNPSYSLYPVLAKMQGAELEEFDFEPQCRLPLEKIAKSGANVFILTNPNAPLGVAFGEPDLKYIADNFRGLFVVDEAYAPFSGRTAAKFAAGRENVLTVCTSSKGWGLAGMRVGWAVAHESIIEILDRVRDSYNVDRLAQAAAVAALGDAEYYREFVAKVVEEREKAEEFFASLGWDFFKSSSNFIFVRPRKNGRQGREVASELFDFLKSEKILVRYWKNDEKIWDGLRITVGTKSEMQKLKESVLKWISKE